MTPPVGESAPRRQPVTLEDLTPHQLELVGVRFGHVMEAETGFRGGDPGHASEGEPRPGYDPAITTVTQRRAAKVAELAGLGPEQARMLGFTGSSERTLRRLAASCRRSGMAGCIKGSWLRRSGARPSITAPVREAIHAVHQETLHRSRVSMATRERLIHQYVRERFGPEITVPCSETLRTVWIEWFGPGGTRQRYVRSAARLETTSKHVRGERVIVHRPGEVVALDTTILPVKVRESVFGDPVSAHLTLALDVATRSLPGFRLTLVSDTSVDVAMVLRDVMTPRPMRAGWDAQMEWRYPGVSADVVAELAGYRVAGVPFLVPETVTTDHGSVYKNHHLVEVQRVLGINILPARVLRPTDKQAVERAFGAIQSLLFETLPGYQGVDVADRGENPEDDAVLTVAEMEHLIATWIVGIWQNRRLGEHAPTWDPGGGHSPNTLFAAAMAQGGFAVQVPHPQLYYELLAVHFVAIHGRRGVKIGGLWYDGAGLDPYRGGPSARGGRHKGKWAIRRDPRDRRFVFFADPDDGRWHTLRWTGLPADGEVPSFGDARVLDLLRAARAAGLTPRSDAELLPVLLELIGGHTPVQQWATQQPARPGPRHRREHSREVAQAVAASDDRHWASRASATRDATPAPEPAPDSGAAAVAPAFADRVEQTWRAVDAERRHRREQLTLSHEPPPRLGAGLSRRSAFVLPAADTADTAALDDGGVGGEDQA